MSLLSLYPHLPGALPPERRATPQPARGLASRGSPAGEGRTLPQTPSPDHCVLSLSNTNSVSEKPGRVTTNQTALFVVPPSGGLVVLTAFRRSDRLTRAPDGALVLEAREADGWHVLDLSTPPPDEPYGVQMYGTLLR